MIMNSTWRFLFLALVAGGVGAEGLAQVPVPGTTSPGLSPYPLPSTPVVVTVSPYWGYSYDPYYPDVLHGMADILRGGAQVIRSEGDYLVKFQEAKILREQVRAARLENRKKEWEQWAWEQDFLEKSKWAARERDEKETRRQALERSPTKIISGWALNELREVLEKDPSKWSSLRSKSLPGGIMDNINMTTVGIGRVNTGLFKQRELPWPLLILEENFSQRRLSADQKFIALKDEALNKGTISPKTVKDLEGDLDWLEEECNKLVQGPDAIKVGCDDSIHARRALKDLKRAVGAIKSDPSGKSITGILKPVQATSVGDLISEMHNLGLIFAPALQGNEQSYYALHNKLAEAVRELGLDPAPSTGK